MNTKILLHAGKILLLSASVLTTQIARGQYLLNSDSAFKANVPMSGHLWGYVFGDYYYKAHSDALNRGGSNQYTGIPQNRNAFQLRRVYLGYDFNVTKKFSTELLLAAEDNFPAGNPVSSAAPSGDQLLNNKLSFYLKLADVRWKNIWKGTDLVVGQVSTPGFALLSEKVWSYRSIERTITDIRRTPSYDLGITLQGVFDPAKKNYGYDLMVGNGSSAKPEGDNFKWFYGDVWAKFFDQKLVVDVYADYERLNWVTNWHHSRQMLKGYIAYTTPALTIGAEGFINNLKNDVFATETASEVVDTLNNMASGLSFYVEGNIVKNKLRFFARYDAYNPTNQVDNNKYNKYVQNTGNYNDNSYTDGKPTGDETYKQSFVTAGLDYSPVNNVHVMPNVWYNHYATQLSGASDKAKGDYDLVYRLTFYYTFGK